MFGALSTIDYGDTPTSPGYIEDTLARISAFVTPLAQAGVVSVGIGGDHSVTLAELRALAAVHGPLGLVHLDSHTDLWDEYNGHPYSHGTKFRRALEEGVVDPARMLQAGIRGPLYGEADEEIPAALGVDTISWIELAEIAPERVRRRAPGTGSATDPRSSPSTWTSSTPRSAPAPGPPRWAARRAFRRCRSCARSPGCPSSAMTSSRWRPPTTGPVR